ncbi:hypothetical protein CPC08DRAFT_723877 [Agrocybe pediades]|nr:hypothetical protein CPC08DRAFT_723877 [Agrocybe pediades]
MFSERRQEKSRVDWFIKSVKDGALVLSIVEDAANRTPVPNLQRAGGVTLRIVKAVPLVRYNKAGFRRLVEYAAAFIVMIHDRYINSTQEDKTSWPPAEIAQVIEELLGTLKEIFRFVEDKAGENRVVRLINGISDDRLKVKEYHHRLHGVEEKFQNIFVIPSHLSLEESVALILKKVEEGQSFPKQTALEEPDDIQAKIEAGRRRNQDLEAKRAEEMHQIEAEAKQQEAEELASASRQKAKAEAEAYPAEQEERKRLRRLAHAEKGRKTTKTSSKTSKPTQPSVSASSPPSSSPSNAHQFQQQQPPTPLSQPSLIASPAGYASPYLSAPLVYNSGHFTNITISNVGNNNSKRPVTRSGNPRSGRGERAELVTFSHGRRV